MKKITVCLVILALLMLTGCFWSKSYGRKTIEHEWVSPKVQHHIENGKLVVSVTAVDQEIEVTHWELPNKGETSPPDRKFLNSKTSPLANWPVNIALPAGTTFVVNTGSDGKAEIDLPDDPGYYRPLKFIVRIEVTASIKTIEKEIPADKEGLSLLPPTTMAWVDSLTEKVRREKAKYDEAKSAYDTQMKPFKYFKASHPQFWLHGEIQDRSADGTWMQLWGIAQSNRVDRSHIGQRREKSNLTILNYNTFDVHGKIFEQFPLYFVKKVYIDAKYGRGQVPVFVYDSETPKVSPKEKSKRARYLREKSKRYPEVEAAKAQYEEALSLYNEALPTDPYGFNPASQKGGK